jgi:hypothetical protein
LTSIANDGLRYAAELRRELSARNRQYAAKHGLRCFLSYGEVPTVAYEPDDEAHGNFLAPAYRAIVAHPGWRLRLEKAHSQGRTALPPNQRGCWKELDSSNSSDALLMNIFCYPATLSSPLVYTLLGEEPGAVPEFGVKARVPLASGNCDRTEVDMRLGNLLVEAKLTETDFQQRARSIVEGYRDFHEVFDRRRLPRKDDYYVSYQLIRNVLAAHATGCSFCVLLDARRHDLREAWYQVMKCVRRPVPLRLRLKVLTWQELAEALPSELREFLDEKYGIVAGVTGADWAPA